jgi:GntP family gluconate:H+ symporter
MTRAVLRIVGRSRAAAAMNLSGYVVSIPVFCDSGYVILTPLNRALAAETGTSMAVMAVALSTGLYATHTLVPPTPGPLAATGALGADLGKVILFGLLAALPASLAGLLWARKVGGRYDIKPEARETTADLAARFERLPNAVLSFVPILLPILLILLKSVADFPSKPFGAGRAAAAVHFIGEPVTALMLGVISSLFLVPRGKLGTALGEWSGEGIKDAAVILAITAAGGSFGKVLQASPMVDFIRTHLTGLHLGLVLPWVIAAALKTAQGSSTVAIITTATILAPLMKTLGLDPALTAVTIGAGSMVVSHANDSYFWVVSQFSGMPVGTAYKIYTTATAVQGVVALLACLLMSLFA